MTALKQFLTRMENTIASFGFIVTSLNQHMFPNSSEQRPNRHIASCMSPQSRAAEFYSMISAKWKATQLKKETQKHKNNRVQEIPLANWKGKDVMMLSRMIWFPLSST